MTSISDVIFMQNSSGKRFLEGGTPPPPLAPTGGFSLGHLSIKYVYQSGSLGPLMILQYIAYFLNNNNAIVADMWLHICGYIMWLNYMKQIKVLNITFRCNV